MNEGLEVIGRESGGGLIPLFMTLGLLPQSGGACAILRDITGWKQREDDLRAARRDARRAEEERETFLSALRYELRQPLDAIVSLSETMSHEAFGPLGDERYQALAREVGTKGRQARGVVGRLLGEQAVELPEPASEPAPAAEIEEPVNTAVQVNDAVAEAVSLVQPRANARRIIIRAALSPQLTETPSDPETLKQIAIELLQEAVQFTPAGGDRWLFPQPLPPTGKRCCGSATTASPPRAVTRPAKTSQPIHAWHGRDGLSEGLGGRFLVHAVPNEGMLVEVFLPAADARTLHY